MSIMRSTVHALGFCAAVAMLAACGAQPVEPQTTSFSPQSLTPFPLLRNLTGGAQTRATRGRPFVAGPNLYVANYDSASVTVYKGGTKTVLRTIVEGVDSPDAMAFDGTGDLYVANSFPPYTSNTITVYAPQSIKVLRTISQGIDGPKAIALDGSGNLYVANVWNNTITVYASGSKSVLRKIHTPCPNALALDSSGNVYVIGDFCNSGIDVVRVYRAGTSKLLREISQDGAQSLTIDSSDTLYVASSDVGTIDVYAPGKTSSEYSITQGLDAPLAMVTDSSDNLYVGNWYGTTVTVYASGSASVWGVGVGGWFSG